jgi:hypothetical protein
MITIFMILSTLAIFAYTLVSIVDRQLMMRDNTKNITAINFIAESVLFEVMNHIRLNPDLIRNKASIYEGAKIINITSRAEGYIPEDLIGSYYSYKMPGKFMFSSSDLVKSVLIEFSELLEAFVIGVRHEEGAGINLNIYYGTNPSAMNILYEAEKDSVNDITGSEIFIEKTDGLTLQYLRINYGDIPDREIDSVFVFDTSFYYEGEMKTDFSDELNKLVYNYIIKGNRIYLTARLIRRESQSSNWVVFSSQSIEATFYIDEGGNLIISDRKNSQTVLPFPDKYLSDN